MFPLATLAVANDIVQGASKQIKEPPLAGDGEIEGEGEADGGRGEGDGEGIRGANATPVAEWIGGAGKQCT